MNTMPFRFIVALLGCFAIAGPQTVLAGDFSVAPIRIFLDNDRKSGVVTVKNNGNVPLRFEILPKQWTQSPDGEDVYAQTSELLVFPRLMSLDGGQERDIRIGTKVGTGKTEKTYRVFINELPPSTQSDTSTPGAANVAFLINFGLPVFVAPFDPGPVLKVSNLSVSNGQVKLQLNNAGNVFQFIQDMVVIGLDASGVEMFREAISDRYLLAGTAKSYTAVIPPDYCKALAAVALEVSTDKMSANANTNVDADSCASSDPDNPR
jgi:fimbrial chaperone protein